MTKQWLDMGLRPRAVTRDLEWVFQYRWTAKHGVANASHAWFEAVQGYSTCARIWSKTHAPSLPDGEETWKRWWCVGENGTVPRHLYFLGKDNIPFHTVIWPALILGLNHVHKGGTASEPVSLPGPGNLRWRATFLRWSTSCLQGDNFRNQESMRCGFLPSLNAMILTP